MFDDLLVNTAKAYPIRLIGDRCWGRNSSPDHRRKALLQELNEIWCQLTGLAEHILGTTIVDEHLVEFLYHDPSGFDICSIRLRPPDEYYHTRHRPLPTPKNPAGPSATGIEIDMSLYRGYATPERGIVAQRVLIDFRVWGKAERKAFKTLYFDQHKEVNALLSMVPLTFSTAHICERLDIAPDTAQEQLKAYFAKDDDREHNFQLRWKVLVSEDPVNSLSAYTAMLALYSACHEYMSPVPPNDRLIEYLRSLDLWYEDRNGRLSSLLRELKERT